jgi:FtsP/CotA-like multicopper oxidase with cupredoxin domain
VLTPLALAISAALAISVAQADSRYEKDSEIDLQALPGGTLDPLTIPKYVTPLVIPPVMNDNGTANDFDIAVRQFQQQILPGGLWATLPGCAGQNCTFPPTTVWSYGPDADPTPVVAPSPSSQFNYPSYTVEATKDAPTTVDWINQLVVNPDVCKTLPAGNTDPACNFLPHFLPVDRSLHWANPEGLPCTEPGRTKDCAPDPSNGLILNEPYLGPVPMVTHLHGSHAGPESDGYAEAWWLPAANNIDCMDSPDYPATLDPADDYWCNGTMVNQFGIKTNSVPGVGTFSYLNDQPAATFWFHDHSLGMTRNNVYAGPAGFYLLRDPLAAGGETGLQATDANGRPTALPSPAPVAGQGVLDLNVPGNPVRAAVREIPVVIQDRAFNTDGSLFYPGDRAFFEGLPVSDLQIPFIGDPDPSDIHAIWNPEAFFNTMVVNGVTWPNMEVEPDIYRFRLLNGSNSRFINLALFEVTGPGADGIFGTADDTLGAEVPFYQIGAEQSLLPQVVEVKTGYKTPLPGDSTIPAPVPAAAPEEALLMGSAERADVLIDFRALSPGTRVRMINTAPDEPFGGFQGFGVDFLPADPATTGQIMEFTVVADDLGVGENFTPPQDLRISPVENVDTYPAGLPNNTVVRDQALLEEESILVCVTIDAVTGVIAWDPAAVPDPLTPETCILPDGTVASSIPFAPKAAVLGVNGASTKPTVTLWSDPVVTNPQFDAAGNPPTETWELWNHTVDAHPIHVHEVKFKVLNREVFDPLTGSLVPGTLRAAESTEAGWKDTVISYPGEVTRLATTLDIKGLYMWHCHIVEHEDNEMMVPYCIGNKDPALGPVAPGCILNEPPVAVDDAYSTKKNTVLKVPAPGVLANDTDINANNVLTAILVSGPAQGTLQLNPDGSFTYTPKANFSGTDTFTYKANDGVLDSLNAATVTIRVTPKGKNKGGEDE